MHTYLLRIRLHWQKNKRDKLYPNKNPKKLDTLILFLVWILIEIVISSFLSFTISSPFHPEIPQHTLTIFRSSSFCRPSLKFMDTLIVSYNRLVVVRLYFRQDYHTVTSSDIRCNRHSLRLKHQRTALYLSTVLITASFTS